MTARKIDLWVLQIPGWLLVAYLVYAQAITAFDYQLGVQMGTQESAEQITEVGVAFWYGFAFADLVLYIPLLVAGLIGYWHRRSWGRVVLGAALGITAYWPIVVLAAAVDARGAAGWYLDETPYWPILSVILLWSVAGLYRIVRVEPERSG